MQKRRRRRPLRALRNSATRGASPFSSGLQEQPPAATARAWAKAKARLQTRERPLVTSHGVSCGFPVSIVEALESPRLRVRLPCRWAANPQPSSSFVSYGTYLTAANGCVGPCSVAGGILRQYEVLRTASSCAHLPSAHPHCRHSQIPLQWGVNKGTVLFIGGQSSIFISAKSVT